MKQNTIIASVLLIGLFFVLLILPQILSPVLVSLEDTRKENRKLEPFPSEFRWRRFFPDLEAWYNDRIPFRTKLLVASRAFSGFMFPENHQRLIRGKDGFYFYAPKGKEENTYDQYAGLRSPRDYEVTKLVRKIRKIMDTAKELHCRLIIFIPPNKIDVYPDKLPEKRNAAFSKDGWPEKLNEAVKKQLPDAPFYYVRPEMYAYRNRIKYPLYYPADTHWNYIGAYCGMKLMTEKSGLPWPKNWKLPEQAEVMPTPHHAFEELLPMADHAVRRKNLPDFMIKGFPRNPPDIKRTKGNWHYITENPKAPDPREVIVFHDSFMLAMSPYISAYFRKVHFYWSHFNKDIAISIKPDLIILEGIARYVYSL